jgi:hypothetical protein
VVFLLLSKGNKKMYYTIDYKTKEYKIKVNYNEFLQEYIITDGFVVKTNRRICEQEKIEIEMYMPEVIYEIGYAEDIFKEIENCL